MEVLFAVTITALLVVIILMIATHSNQMQRIIKQHGDERKDLLDRIMSHSFKEYKHHTTTPISSGPVDLSEEEEYNREIEQIKRGGGDTD